MTELVPPVIREIRTWQRIRRYAVPADMIAACTAAREVGDWRAAGEAARIDVAFDLADVRREHGRKQTELIETDLGALAPDLLRWHLPRVLGGRTSLATHRQMLLSVREGRMGERDVALMLCLPKTVDGSQRMRLNIGPALGWRSGQRDLPPVFWSAEHVSGLAAAYGGSERRLPGFDEGGGVRPFEAYATGGDPADPPSRMEAFDRHICAGDLVAAWAAAGIDLDASRPAGAARSYDWDMATAAAGGIVPVGLDAELTRLHARYGVRRVMLGRRWRRFAEVRRRDDGTLASAFQRYDSENFKQPCFANVVHARPADLELVRHGLLDPTELHPLVRQVLFPSLPAPTVPANGSSDLRVDVPVRCRGEWHTVAHGDGRLDLAAHTEDEITRENVLRTLGGRSSGCFAVLEAWRGSGGRLPRRLRQLRRDVLLRVQHGGSATLNELLDAGLDPRMCDGRGGSLLHHLRAMDNGAPVRRLVAAGVPVNAANRAGRTALHVTVGDGGSPEMVSALLAAGADPWARDRDEMTVGDLAGYKAEMYADDEVPQEYQEPVRIRDVVNDWMNR